MIKEIAFGIIISLLLISLVVLFCAILIKLYIKKIKQHNIQELEFQKTLNQTILETQKQLLNSISEDLHDDAGQQLTVINFQIENLKLDFPDKEKDLQPISESVAKLSKSLREISHSLNSNMLEKKGLIVAIEEEISRIKKTKLIKVIYNSEGTKISFVNEKQIVLYRIFQETINNILKHSKASEIFIDITFNPIFEIKIQDNGVGFELNKKLKKTNSLGLQNCINRAKLINYIFKIESHSNSGTTFILKENKKI